MTSDEVFQPMLQHLRLRTFFLIEQNQYNKKKKKENLILEIQLERGLV